MNNVREKLRLEPDQLNFFQKNLQDRNPKIKMWWKVFQYREIQIKAWQEVYQARESHIRAWQEAYKARESRIMAGQETCQEGESHITAYQDQENQIKAWQEACKDRENQIKAWQEACKDRENQIKAWQEACKDLETQIRELQKDQHQICRLREELIKKATYFQELESGIGWKILVYYRKKIKNRIAPVGTIRRITYDNFLKWIKLRKKEHLEIFTEKGNPHSIIKYEEFVVSTISAGTAEAIDKKVSVIIPTKNAGQDFYHVLETIKKQKGIKDIELIIIDSGSEDDTLNLSKRYHAKIFSIVPSEFNHGLTRNFGARDACGDYLVFLSQDAIPVGDTCFLNMLRGMNNDPNIAAVSARQVPRVDADLFACWQIWNHYEKFLRYKEDTVISVDPKRFDSLPPSDKRRAAQLDNIFSCIRKDVFDKFKFNDLKYAEDLDLGLRLLKNGYKIGFLSSVSAIHSHNREPLYYFKRSFIDKKTLIRLVDDEPIDWYDIGIDSFSSMIYYICTVYRKLSYILDHVAQSEIKHSSPSGFFNSLRYLILSCRSSNKDVVLNNSLHLVIDELSRIAGEGRRKGSVKSVKNDVILQQFLSMLEGFEEYLSSYENIDKMYDDIVSALHKLFALIIGASIADYATFYKVKNRKTLMLKLEGIFGEGI
jgi:GT2 family glycosyltransferase